MAIKIDENYNDSTLLADWWQKVKSNFTLVKDAIEQEVSDRQSAMSGEVTARNKAIAAAIEGEEAERDDAIAEAIAQEVTDRDNAIGRVEEKVSENAENIVGINDSLDDINKQFSGEHESVLLDKIEVLEKNKHTHDNKSVLDGITAEKVAKWDSGNSTVSGGSSIYPMSDYSVSYYPENGGVNVYAQGQPDDMPLGIYIFEPEQEIDHIFLVSADGESELATYAGKLYPGTTYIIRFDAASSDVIAKFENVDVTKINEAIAIANEDIDALQRALGAKADENDLRTAEVNITANAEAITDLRTNVDSIKIPFYVQEEADRVAKEVLSHQNVNTFSFIAVSDVHYQASSNNSKASLNDLSYALKSVSNQLKLDFAVDLGDKVWGNQASTTENTVDELRVVNSKEADGFRGIQNLQMWGNHDVVNTTAADRFAGIGIYNKGVIYGDRARGYCYYDLEDLKVRVIVMNTSNRDTYVSGIVMTEAQTTWVCEILTEMLDKPDWNILFLSHIPVDFKQTDITTNSTIHNIFIAYESGSTITVNEVDYDFSSENRATIIAQVHGHLHNLNTNKIDSTNITRLCVPHAYPGRYNEYSADSSTVSHELFGEFNDDGSVKIYEKTQGTATSTAFNVITVDLDAKIIYATNYGAGVDRVIGYESEIVSYSITNTLTNVTNSNGTTTVIENTAYSATLTADSGYELETITVTMGGEDVTSTVYSNGIITISAVTGDITITATAIVEDTTITVAQNYIYEGVDTDGSLYNGTGYKEGYRLNSSGGESAASTGIVSGFIPFAVGDVIRVYGATNSSGTASGHYCSFYDSSFAHKTQFPYENYGTWEAVTVGDTTRYMWTYDTSSMSSDRVYFRASMIGCTADDFIITINEEIV